MSRQADSGTVLVLLAGAANSTDCPYYLSVFGDHSAHRYHPGTPEFDTKSLDT